MRNRRSQSAPAPALVETNEPPLRLRHLLLPLAFGCFVWGVYPRAKAAWALHDAATALADYARCMGGPMGPGAVREDPSAFRDLIRRRLLAAQPEDRPFAACGPLAQEVVAGPETERAHNASALQFSEYSELPTALPDDKESFSLAAVGFSQDVLQPLNDAAWPFERGNYRHLIEASSTAKEAAHPVPLPLPAYGSGFPAKQTLYRSTWTAGGRWFAAFGSHTGLALAESPDFGITWKAASLNQPGLARYAGRCAQLGAETSFTVDLDESGWKVQAFGGEQVLSVTRLGSGLEAVRTACDAKTLLLVVTTKPRQTPAVLSCESGRGCAPLTLDPAWLSSDFDVAQIEGVSVILTSGRGLTRVRSSRDRGATWTPSIVAFDTASLPAATLPNQLIVMGRRLMLFGQPVPRKTYPVLYSDDYGASFHGVEVAPAAVPPRNSIALRQP